MALLLLEREAKISAIARCLRPLKNLDDADPIKVALKAEFQLVDVERLFKQAIEVERARRQAMRIAA